MKNKHGLTTDLIQRSKNGEDEAILELWDIFEQKIRWFASESVLDSRYGEVMVLNSDYADL